MDSLDQYSTSTVSPPSDGPKGLLIGIAVALATVLVSMLFVNQALHPTLFVYVILIVTTSLGLVIVWGFFGSAIARAVFKRRRQRREETATARLTADFKALVEEFFDFIDPMRGNYIVNTMERWKSVPEFSHLPRVDLHYVREAYRHVQDRLRMFKGNSDEFCRLVSEFEASLKLHHEVCVCLPLDALQQFPVEKLTGSYREDYRTAKRKYEAFIERYQAFAKKLNAAFGRKASDISFRDLKEL